LAGLLAHLAAEKFSSSYSAEERGQMGLLQLDKVQLVIGF